MFVKEKRSVNIFTSCRITRYLLKIIFLKYSWNDIVDLGYVIVGLCNYEVKIANVPKTC